MNTLPDYPGSVKCFIKVEITLVSSVLMILTRLEKETRLSLGAPRAGTNNIELSGIDEDCRLTEKKKNLLKFASLI